MAGFVPGAEVLEDLVLEPDVCIVGSGAGGSVLAARLAQRGHSVIVLEEGGYHTADGFDMLESTAFPKLYQDLGNRTTADLSMTILQGKTVGGGTVVNWTTCFRLPDRILQHWADVHGVSGLTPEVLRPHFEAVEARLNIHPWPVEGINPNNDILWRAAGALGWDRSTTSRNVKGCMSTGYCGMGCPIDAKQAMHLTYLPDAIAKGATVYANVRAEHLEIVGRKVRAVHGVVLDRESRRATGVRVTVKAKLTAICGGAINTPLLLLRNGLNHNGRVGLRASFHPVVGVGGLYERIIEPYYGAPQSVYSHHFQKRGEGKIGWFLETAPGHPMLAATALGGFGESHRDTMKDLPHTGSLIAVHTDGLLPEEPLGTVRLRRDGRPRIDYPFHPKLLEAFREAMKAMARGHLAAGAVQCGTLHEEPVIMKSEADIARIDDAPFDPLDFPVFSAHAMGGACMGSDPNLAVVDSTLKHHEFDNLFVVDGSVFPTGLGVNPSESIYGLAHWAAGHVSDAV